MFQQNLKRALTLQVIMNGRRILAGCLGLDELPRPLRPLAIGAAASAVGSGLWFTLWALYLTQRVGLSSVQAGAALSIAGAVGFCSPAPLGRLADRRGPREVYAALLAAEGLAVLGFLLCHSFAAVAGVAAATAACDQGKTGVRAALISQLAPAEGRVGALACLRSCAHTGDAIGAGLAALVITLNSGPAYAAAIAVNGVSYLAYAIALHWVPHVPPCSQRQRGPRLGAFRDLPYTSLAAICGVLTLCWGLLSAGLPLWIATRTRAPHALAGIVILSSSVAIASLQVRFSQGTDTPRAASGVALRSGLSLAACCVLFALAAGPDPLTATALLLAGTVAHILGELWFVAASWGLSVPLMPADRPAEYQGVFATGEALAIMLAPALMTGAVVPGGVAGWLALGLGFAAAGAAATPAARWATRSHRGAHPFDQG
jgi:MFS family permease